VGNGEKEIDSLELFVLQEKYYFIFGGNGEKEIDSLELFVLQEKYYFIFGGNGEKYFYMGRFAPGGRSPPF
jgi:uncharacterized protein YpmB